MAVEVFIGSFGSPLTPYSKLVMNQYTSHTPTNNMEPQQPTSTTGL